VVNNNIRRFGGTIQGAVARQDPREAAQRRRAEAELEDEAEERATLSTTPRTLSDMWIEYKHVFGGRKPAEQFTSRERNNPANGLKQKYYRRNVVWQTIARIVRGGATSAEAIHRIKESYGHKQSVTQIINKMIRDRPAGHPNLQV
jgi:hypothetical protein